MNRNGNSQGLIIGIIIVLVLLIGITYLFQANNEDAILLNEINNTEQENVNPNNDNNPFTVTTSTTTTTTTNSANSSDTAFTIQTADLSPEQRTALTASGFEGDEIVITNGMKTCAEQSIGLERTRAFADGEKPTVIEMGKLLVCYNQ